MVYANRDQVEISYVIYKIYVSTFYPMCIFKVTNVLNEFLRASIFRGSMWQSVRKSEIKTDPSKLAIVFENEYGMQFMNANQIIPRSDVMLSMYFAISLVSG